MPELLSLTTSVLLLILPWPLIVVGLVAGNADRHPRPVGGLTKAAAGFALAGAVLATYFLSTTASSNPSPTHWPAMVKPLALSLDVNRITLVMLWLVAMVGMIVPRYAHTYLAGDIHQGRLHRWLCLTL